MKKLILMVLFGTLAFSSNELTSYTDSNKGDVIAKIGIQFGGRNGEVYSNGNSLDVLFGIDGQFEYLHPVYVNQRFKTKIGGGLETEVLGTFSSSKNSTTVTTSSTESKSETTTSSTFGTYSVSLYATPRMEYAVTENFSLYTGARVGIGAMTHHKKWNAVLPANVYIGGEYNKVLLEVSGGLSWVINQGSPYYNGKLMVGYELNKW